MSNPFPRNKYRHPAVELDFTHFKWRRMPVTQEIADKTAVLRRLFGALPVRYSSGLDDGFVAAHVVHEPDETFIQNRDFLFKEVLQRCVSYSLRFHRFLSVVCIDLGTSGPF